MRKSSGSKRKAEKPSSRRSGEAPARATACAEGKPESPRSRATKGKTAAEAPGVSAVPAASTPPPRSFLAVDGKALGLLVAPFLVVTVAIAASEWIGPKDAARRQFALLPAARAAAAAVPSLKTLATAAPSRGMEVAATRQAVVLNAIARPENVGPAPVRLASTLPPATHLDQASPTVFVVATLAKPDRVSKCAVPRPLGAAQSQPIQSMSPEAFGRLLARAALDQTRDLVVYTDTYRQIGFPMGDVPGFYGVCTDVVVRAYRALGIDLQVLVHKARIGTGDTSIDHRRTGTLRRFFARYGVSLPVTDFPEDYRPGDIVTYYRATGRTSQSHIAIVADVIAPSGRPMIVHNRGWGPQLEDALFASQVTGHYRYMPSQPPDPAASRTVAPAAEHAAAQTPLPAAVLAASVSR